MSTQALGAPGKPTEIFRINVCDALFVTSKASLFKQLSNLVTILVSGLAIYCLSCSVALAEENKINVLEAVAKDPVPFSTPDSIKSVQFTFDPNNEHKAWLKSNGDWKIEGWIQHKGLLCGTYEMGIRFGQGKPGCVNVKWLTTPHYVSRRLQCNNVRLHHVGHDNNPKVISQYENITCAQSMVRCNGRCAN